MKATYVAQPHDNEYKHQKMTNFKSNKPSTSCDLHTLLHTVEQVKCRLEKEIRQRDTNISKHKHNHGNKKGDKPENTMEAENSTSPDDFACELEQLSLSDVGTTDLENLEPLSYENFTPRE